MTWKVLLILVAMLFSHIADSRSWLCCCIILHHKGPRHLKKDQEPVSKKNGKTNLKRPDALGDEGTRKVVDILWPRHHSDTTSRTQVTSSDLEKPIVRPGFRGSSDRPRTERPYLCRAFSDGGTQVDQFTNSSMLQTGSEVNTGKLVQESRRLRAKDLQLILQHLTTSWRLGKQSTVWDGFLDTFLARSFKGKFYSRLRLREIKLRRMRRMCSMCSQRWAAFTTQEPSRIETAVDNQPVDLSSQAFGSSWTFTSNEQNQSNTGWYWKVMSGAMESEWSRRLSRVEELEKARGVQ